MSATGARRFAFTLMEAFAVMFLLAGLAFVAIVLMPSWRRGPGISSRRLVCAANLKGIGTTCKIYANDNNGAWPVPPFDESRIGLIDYTVQVGGGAGSIRSPGRMQPSVGGSGGARQLSVTRAFWMLVRSGDIVPRQFVCPQSGDMDEHERSIDEFYDFAGYKNVSYGFQVPFGPSSTRAHEGRDNRMALAADKGPYVDADVATPTAEAELPVGPRGSSYGVDPKPWRPFNSPNHGNEGQNVLFADGHAAFMRTPVVGVDHDNIYTIATEGVGETDVWFGESPWEGSSHPRGPMAGGGLSGTDSVIFP